MLGWRKDRQKESSKPLVVGERGAGNREGQYKQRSAGTRQEEAEGDGTGCTTARI